MLLAYVLTAFAAHPIDQRRRGWIDWCDDCRGNDVQNNGVLERLHKLNPMAQQLDRAHEDKALSTAERGNEDKATVLKKKLAGNACGSGMWVLNTLPTMDEQVMDVPGDWMAGCNACGQFLETYRVNGFCSGWYCEISYFGPIATGVYLKRNGQPCPPMPAPVPAPAPGCTPIYSATGQWVPVASTSDSVSYKVTHGVTRATTDEESHDWGVEAGAEVSAGFDVPAVGSASVSISASASANFGRSYSQYFEARDETEFTFTANSAGQMWQWQFDIYDRCGTNTVKGLDVVLTDNQANPPCCLPGHFDDPTKPENPDCVATWGETEVYNLCAATVKKVSA